MSLDVWFKDDIRNTLLALNETSHDTHAQIVALCGESASARSYRSGYSDALRAVAIAFGVAIPRTQVDDASAMPRLEFVRPIKGIIVGPNHFGGEGGA